MSEPEPEPRTAGEVLARSREFLERKGVDEARLEAELLVAHALGLDRLRLYLAFDRPVEPRELARARDWVRRRGRREPTAYILGEREFYGRRFGVDRRVLIPRPETELLVDLARECFGSRAGHALEVADIGTGSGCLAITLFFELAPARVLAVDLSADALAVARENAARWSADVTWVEGDGLSALESSAIDAFDLVVSNPPYVDPRERAALAPEVRDHEPALALFAPEGRPDAWVERLLERAVPRLAPGGKLLVELGAGQAERVLAACAERGLAARTRRDLARIERVLVVDAPG